MLRAKVAGDRRRPRLYIRDAGWLAAASGIRAIAQRSRRIAARPLRTRLEARDKFKRACCGRAVKPGRCEAAGSQGIRPRRVRALADLALNLPAAPVCEAALDGARQARREGGEPPAAIQPR